MTDWIVWPLFVLQGFIFLLYFVKSRSQCMRIRLHLWIILLLLCVNIGIIVSLFHDSSTVTGLYF